MLVAVIEDDPIIAKSVSAAVRAAGHECRCVADGDAAACDETMLSSDLVILDLMLPGGDGIDLIRSARGRGLRTPVIVLTARGAIEDKLEACGARADHYLPKPFEMDELLARIEAVRRRSSDKPVLRLEAGPLSLCLGSKRLAVGGRTVELTPTESSLIELLLRYQGQVVTRKMLCEHLWGFDWDGPTNVIEVHVNRLRGKIDRGRSSSFIRTVRGRGYALATED
jgi:two-component system OmpR family response regulator